MDLNEYYFLLQKIYKLIFFYWNLISQVTQAMAEVCYDERVGENRYNPMNISLSEI